MRFSLRQLHIFEAVARHLSYTRAAEELHLTQPAVFAQIKQLEDSVGLPLLERLGKQLFLTAAGREVLATSRETVAAIERLEMRLADMQGLKRGRLRVAMVTTAKYLVPRLLGEFCVRYPGIEASLTVTNREKLLARIANNEDDLAILGIPPEGMDVVATPIADNPLVVIARNDHALARRKRIPLARISEEPFILREPGSGTRLATERHFAEHGLKLKVRMELGSNEAIKQAIAGAWGFPCCHNIRLPSMAQGVCFSRSMSPVFPCGANGMSLIRPASTCPPWRKHFLPICWRARKTDRQRGRNCSYADAGCAALPARYTASKAASSTGCPSSACSPRILVAIDLTTRKSASARQCSAKACQSKHPALQYATASPVGSENSSAYDSSAS